MVDAKLIAVTLTIGMVVVVALTYVSTRSSRANAVEYTDDWSKRLGFICDQLPDTDGCTRSLCNHFEAGAVDSGTPLNIECPDGSSRAASLFALGNDHDWYERALGSGGNTEAPAAATFEWCASTEGEDDSSGFEFKSGDEFDASCAAFVPVLAAAVNAEYTRYVTRAHIAYFKSGFDMLCQMEFDGVAGICDGAKYGFGIESTFQALCKDGQYAEFTFLDTVVGLDKLAADGADEAAITAFITDHCPEAETLPYTLPTCVKPCIEACLADIDADACICADSCNRDSCDEADKAYIQDGVDAECKGRRLSSGVNQLPDTSGATSSLALLIQRSKSGGSKSPISVSRSLGRKHSHSPHGHSPHGHDPHGHAPNDCPGCGNICGNECFGRCGAGCQRWNACGGKGAGAHRACVEHDFECSCGSIMGKSCVGLLWSGDGNAQQACREGNNIFSAPATEKVPNPKDACDTDGNILSEMGLDDWGLNINLMITSTWYLNSAVRNWGKDYGKHNSVDDGWACQRVQMCDSHGGNKYGEKPNSGHSNKRIAANRWYPYTDKEPTDINPYINPYGVTVDMVLDDCTIAGGSWSADKRGDSKDQGALSSWLPDWVLNAGF